MDSKQEFWKSKGTAFYVVGPCYHGMARPQVAGRGTASTANKLNKKSRTADEGWSSRSGVGRGANNPSL